MKALRTVISWTFWPTQVALGTSATYFGFRSGHDLAAVFLVVNVAMMLAVIVAEQLAPRRSDWNALRDRQSVNDIGHGFVQSQLGDRLGELTLLAAAATLAAHWSRYTGSPLWPVDWPIPAQIALVLVVGDGLDYWRHRLLHAAPWLWRMHALHHSISELHVFRASRDHFTAVLLRHSVVYAPLALVGAPAEMIFWHAACLSILGLLGHSNVDIRLPAIAHRLVLTPQYHGLHHSIERELSDSNYANLLPLWDLVFGTFTDPRERPLRAVGIANDPIPGGFLAQCLAPFTWSRLTGAAVAREPQARAERSAA